MDKYSLTIEELDRLMSMVRSSVYILDKSGDYPERQKDKVMYRKLTDQSYNMIKVKRGITNGTS